MTMKFGGNSALQGKQQKQNKRHKHNNLKPQSKMIFWLCNLLSYIELEGVSVWKVCFYQHSQRSSQPLGILYWALAPGSCLHSRMLCSF